MLPSASLPAPAGNAASRHAFDLAVAVRSYGQDSHAHQHDFAQLVLPLSGALDIDLAGRGARLDRNRAAFVAPGLRHAQQGVRADNRSLIVDLPLTQLTPEVVEGLSARRFVPLTPQALHLIDYMGLTLSARPMPPGGASQLALWAPLMLQALLQAPPHQRPLRLAVLLAAPSDEWLLQQARVADLAARVGLSSSRLHHVFRTELGTTPQAWLNGRRLEQVRRWLADTDWPLSEIALRAGYADQSAMTRALRRDDGLTPSDYRRRSRLDATGCAG